MRTYLSSNRTTNHACRTGYTLDAADRRIRTALPDDSAWDYAYDDLGQLTSAQRDSINAMTYAYDTIGNRQTATEDGTSTAYTANDLNQYTAVNSETPTYDADGNLLSWAGWTYTWNAENRLIRAENGSVRVEANYDYLGRRFEKKVFYGNTLTQHQYFLYDGYKLAAITDALDENRVTTTFTWQPTGPDTPLTMTYKGVTGYYLTDGNKNVLKVVKSDGMELATYTYSPFGQTLAATGPWAQLNPFRFSSEYHDAETVLIYYNYRHYSPILGRWLSRDPIGEDGGVNLYGMVNNNSINYWDGFGLDSISFSDVFEYDPESNTIKLRDDSITDLFGGQKPEPWPSLPPIPQSMLLPPWEMPRIIPQVIDDNNENDYFDCVRKCIQNNSWGGVKNTSNLVLHTGVPKVFLPHKWSRLRRMAGQSPYGLQPIKIAGKTIDKLLRNSRQQKNIRLRSLGKPIIPENKSTLAAEKYLKSDLVKGIRALGMTILVLDLLSISECLAKCNQCYPETYEMLFSPANIETVIEDYMIQSFLDYYDSK